MIILKNYNKLSNSKERDQSNNDEKSFTEKLKEKVTRIDQAENIKEQIRKQEEQIQSLKNSISVYFVDKCEFVNLREESNRNSLVLSILKHGTLIEPVVYNDTTEWTKVQHKDKTGYVMTKYIGVEVSEPVE